QPDFQVPGAFRKRPGKRRCNKSTQTARRAPPFMNLRQLIKYLLWRDTTHHREFSTMWRLLSPDAPKIVVDVGAFDGFAGSNSFPFVARGWTAILIEPHPVSFARLQRRFASNAKVTCLNMACAEASGKRPLFLGTDGPAPTLSTL